MQRRWSILWASGLLLAACSDEQTPTEWQGSQQGVTVRVTTSPFEVSIDNQQGEQVLQLFDGEGAYGGISATIDDPTFISHIVPGWDGYRANEGEYRVAGEPRIERTRADGVSVRFGGALNAVLNIQLAQGRARFSVQTDALVPHEPAGRHTKASIAFRLGADEHFFGMGQRNATVDHRGWSLYNWSEEGGLGRGEGAEPGPMNPSPNGVSMTNFPIPLVHSTAGYALHLESTYRSEFHFGSERDDAWRISVNRNAFAFTVYTSSEPLENLDLYTQDTGRPLIPAPWVFGPRRRLSLGDAVFGDAEWKALRSRKVPTTSLDDNVHFLPDLSQVGREAALREWVDTLHHHGFKVMAYNNPYVSMTVDRAEADFAYGAQRRLFLTGSDGWVGEAVLISGTLQTVATIDLTVEEGREWFERLLKRTLDFGYDGWMHDFGEYVARDWYANDGRRGDELHNAFPVLSAKVAHDLMVRERPGDFHFHARSGFSGSQKYVPAVWNGDPEATFDPTQGLPASLYGGVNISMSGIAYWGSDISGFKCYTDDPHDKEMYLRWAQFGAISPIMQSQGACANILGRRPKWTLWSDDETIEVYGEMARLHTRLQPYFLILANEAHETGAPLMRHPFLLFPQAREAWRVREAFFLGDAIYAAPVVHRGEREKTVWLPPGNYLDWNEQRAYVGNQQVTVPAPLVRLPLFLRENRLLPMLDPSIETLAEATSPEVVTPSRVSDRLDVVVFMTDGEATRVLADGTELRIESVPGARISPAAPMNEVEVDSILTCAACFIHESEADSREVARLRFNTELVPEAEVDLGRFRVAHRADRPLRIRWDVYYRP